MIDLFGMETIYYRGDEYERHYKHEGGGTYFVCWDETASPVTSWLDIYPDGRVMYLWNGCLHHLGNLEGNRVVETDAVMDKLEN